MSRPSRWLLASEPAGIRPEGNNPQIEWTGLEAGDQVVDGKRCGLPIARNFSNTRDEAPPQIVRHNYSPLAIAHGCVPVPLGYGLWPMVP